MTDKTELTDPAALDALVASLVAALRNWGFVTASDAADAITALRAENAALRKQIAEAEARGRIAGLKEAEKAVRARVMGDGNRDDNEAKRCADAIRALIDAPQGLLLNMGDEG